ncbi:MAG TPA: GNAT family N-acetyltransferase [Devosia sp.]|nr:GNAT family N-acetyltransferase [Devosia sp.]
MIPTLETDRLTLRPYEFGDFDAYVEMWSDPDVVRFIGGKPFDREASWGRFARHVGQWHYMGFGYFAIIEKETGVLLGEAGFQEVRRILTPSIEGSLEAGWALLPTGQGWGYATEAMSAVIGWADTAFAGQRMTCIINPDNLPSVRVANRLGFREFARTTYKEAPIILFERSAAK